MEVSLKNMDSIIVIVGPTASGKTKISIELAKDINGEIISADSMQVYRFMDIGTAKPNMKEMSGIKHYLIDEILPDEEFSVARFKELALKYIKEIKSKGKIPIIVGGTGLYINSLIYNIEFSETDIDWDLREQLKKEAENKGNKFLHDKLREIDPEAADRIHVNDIKRIIRAIEIFKTTRKPISYHQELSKLNPPEYNFILIGLRMNRHKLYERINKRVDLMLEAGLIEEVKKIKKLGYDKYSVAMQGLGYKEILAYLRGELTYEECIDLLKRNTRRYAKRQITWFRKIQDIYWIDVDKCEDQGEILKNIKYHIASHGIF
jgi:tRNA dimethylallyltransferase